jgi:hypothetical protein
LKRAFYAWPRRLYGAAAGCGSNRLHGNHSVVFASAHFLLGHLDVGAGSGKNGRRLRGSIVGFRQREQLEEIVGFEKPEKSKYDQFANSIFPTAIYCP